MHQIPFVDAHMHLWDLSHLRYPWLTPPFADDGPNGSVAAIAATFLPEEYRRATVRWNVVGAVHVDAGADASHALAETRWLEQLADRDGLPTGIVAFASLADPDVEAVLAAQAANPRVRGIRQIVNWHADPRRTYTTKDVTTDPAWERGYALLAKYGLSFDLQCYPDQMAGLADLIGRHPDVPVAINHIGMPVVTDEDGLDRWQQGMRALAEHRHMSVKLSGPGFAWRNWATRSGGDDAVRDLILRAIDLFGADRAMFATDAPTDTLFASVDRHLETYHAIVADVGEDDRRALFGRNADRFYRLNLGI